MLQYILDKENQLLKNIRFNEITLTFDKPLDEYAVHCLLRGTFDIEEETEYVLKNNINTLRISVTDMEIETVVPYNK
ncbi:MAG: hypothetical protein K2K89_01035 [Ruminococcus sp.]|nr:hypothetical protein [Ruminococcus sp.]